MKIDAASFVFSWALMLSLGSSFVLAESQVEVDAIRAAVERALPLLEIASAGSADQRTCFTCHNQALPIFVLHEAGSRGFNVNRSNLDRQVHHTLEHLKRGRKQYEEGKGQGGGVDTAGYALWSLEESETDSDEMSATVVDWILSQQTEIGNWRCKSNRPPSEASNFTTSYLALRALSRFGASQPADRIEQAQSAAGRWLQQAQPQDTEDHVFRLLSHEYVSLDHESKQTAVEQLVALQREDGGWAQLPTLESDAYATATALYALQQSGALGDSDAVVQRGLGWLLEHQLPDGSWRVTSRSKPFQVYYESGFPHRADQFISVAATAWAALRLLHSLPEREPRTISILAGTQPLELPEADVSFRLMRTAHTFVETQISAANSQRRAALGDSPQAAILRQELRTLLGVIDERSPPRMEHFGDASNPAVIAETEHYEILQVRWPVYADLHGEGLLVQQRGKAVGRVVVIPDADQCPEDLVGFGHSASPHVGVVRKLAEQGFDCVVPDVVSRRKLDTTDERLKKADYTNREWIYRQAFHMGRHVIGYDIERVLAAIDWLTSQDAAVPIGIVGYGEGGLIALHAAAIDERIDATLVSGYFNLSDSIWQEPIYRNVWSRLKKFGNAEVAALVTPRHLVIEHSPFPDVRDHKGELTTPDFEALEREFKKIPKRGEALLISENGNPVGPYSDEAIRKFAQPFALEAISTIANHPLEDRRQSAEQWIEERQRRTWAQLESHVQSLVRGSEHVRDKFFLYAAMPAFENTRWSTDRRHATLNSAELIEAAKSFRRKFHEEAMGRFQAERVPLNARTRKVAESDQWTAYDVVLDVHQGLFSWGMIVIPKDLPSGERRPVVVCQHGRNGLPRDTLDTNSTAYNNFAARLAERGFITFAPHNLYRGEDEYRWLDRKANAIGCTLFSFIIAQHEATLDWLESLPFVDPERIAFYGLSYGGETAVRVPTILEKYCMSICSGDFNQWTRKVASSDQPFSFMNTIEWEMPYWNLGNTFDYAEMAYLMFPRPFMVERGHHDRVARDQWVAHEFAKVRWLYAQFGLADQVAIEFFQGGHSINGVGTFEFLERLRTE